MVVLGCACYSLPSDALSAYRNCSGELFWHQYQCAKCWCLHMVYLLWQLLGRYNDSCRRNGYIKTWTRYSSIWKNDGDHWKRKGWTGKCDLRIEPVCTQYPLSAVQLFAYYKHRIQFCWSGRYSAVVGRGNAKNQYSKTESNILHRYLRSAVRMFHL